MLTFLFLFMRQEVTEIVSSSLNTQPSLVLTLCKTRQSIIADFVLDASIEADVAKGRRDWAFSERDKVLIVFPC